MWTHPMTGCAAQGGTRPCFLPVHAIYISRFYDTKDFLTGMALSRIGLWAFDLCQLKELQTALVDHPRRNAM